ncbi:MAG: DNA mismatch repair protein MutS [Bdellovibrionales bacterium]|nr:DNA mismatch repair protein MutS [Bdellovibrionales bacterium]
MSETNLSPLMKQYWDLKSQVADAILLFRMGDFYEVFAEDAIDASKILEITLTSRDKGKANPTPMAGVPHHSVQGYIQKLLKAGRKVAIGEQMEGEMEPGQGSKSIVKRAITRVFTPAIQFETDGNEMAFLATAIPVDPAHASSDGTWILALLDASTGQTRLSQPIAATRLCLELSQLPIRHFLRIGEKLPLDAASTLRARKDVLLEDLPSNYLTEAAAAEFLKKQFGLAILDVLFPIAQSIPAMAILCKYAAKSQGVEVLAHIALPEALDRPSTLVFGPQTISHLDLLPKPDGTPNLYDFVNQTKTSLGSRLLKRWVTEPRIDLEEIQARQLATAELAETSNTRARVMEKLSEVYDLERITGRITTRLANPRDTYALAKSLNRVADIPLILANARSQRLQEIAARISNAQSHLAELTAKILKTQKEEAPLTHKEAGVFQLGTDPELDRLIRINQDGSNWLVELETRERTQTGIPSLKVRFNRVFGYYIEVTSTHLKNVPAHYQRKQTTVGAERFFTEELKKFEDEIVHAEAKQIALERKLFEQLIEEISDQISWILEASQAVAALDCLQSLSHLLDRPGFVQPNLDTSLDLDIRKGRHPMVDQQLGGRFVPNDTQLLGSSGNQESQILLITGPNMGGKSTVMRQVALIVVLAQMGAAVPAESARIGIVESLYTRIGAQDAISRGQSTFMVEMTELAHILNYANRKSLLILDEIGRGTSTFDGMSVAWATLEWICGKIRARTLFATHYHELTELEGKQLGLRNAHVAVESSKGKNDLRFLYELRSGRANESFGVQVASLAGLPKSVIDRAWKVLKDLEKSRIAKNDAPTAQMDFLSALAEPSRADEDLAQLNSLQSQLREKIQELETLQSKLQEIQDLKIDEMTPLQALNRLAQVKSDFSAYT